MKSTKLGVGGGGGVVGVKGRDTVVKVPKPPTLTSHLEIHLLSSASAVQSNTPCSACTRAFFYSAGPKMHRWNGMPVHPHEVPSRMWGGSIFDPLIFCHKAGHEAGHEAGQDLWGDLSSCG